MVELLIKECLSKSETIKPQLLTNIPHFGHIMTTEASPSTEEDHMTACMNTLLFIWTHLPSVNDSTGCAAFVLTVAFRH